jgi:hypothetical protein
VNLADTLRRLRVDDVQGAGAELDVPPAERERLADPQAAPGKDREQRAACAASRVE